MSGKASLVTGSTAGIGKAIALELAARGDKVGVLGRRRDQADAVVAAIESLGGSAKAIIADVCVADEVQGAVEAFVSWAGSLDCVVANAGIAVPGKISDLPIEDWRRTMAVNLDGAYYTARFAMPHLIASRGNFTIISSHGGVMGVGGYFSYSTSKFALVGLGRSLAMDHAADGVRVNVVCPGPVRTEMTDQNMPHASEAEREAAHARLSPQGRIGTSEEVAKAVAHLSSDDAGYTNGAVLVVDGGSAAAFSMYMG